MKLLVTVNGEDGVLYLERRTGEVAYRLEGAINLAGSASIAEILPGVFSILLGQRSYTVDVIPRGNEWEVWANGHRFTISAADARDRSGRLEKQSVSGPMELRAQMPGRIVKILVGPGAQVKVGQSLIVVEAMKMQNEMKSLKDGVVAKIPAVEGATVAAGEQLMVVE